MIPDDSTLARHIKSTQQFEGEPSGAAYELRKEEEGLSVDWLELLAGTNHSEKLTALMDDFDRTVRKSHFFGLHVKEQLVSYVNRKVGRQLVVENDRIPRISHCVVKGFTHDDQIIAELISECYSEMVPASSFL